MAGSSIGQIRSWNLQSGQERKSFEVKGVAAPSKGKKTKVVKGRKTGSAITGMCTDALNNVLVASTLDGSLNVSTVNCSSGHQSRAHSYRRVLQFFDFHTTTLEHTMKLPANITFMDLHRDSGLLAVVCDDLIVRVLDIETRRIVRELSGPRRPILDMVSAMHSDLSIIC